MEGLLLCFLAEHLSRMVHQRELQKIRSRRHYLKVKSNPQLFAQRREATKEAVRKWRARKKQMTPSEDHWPASFLHRPGY
ncbi:hypothetical protein ACOMHN_022954 [Nucella lapillus]